LSCRSSASPPARVAAHPFGGLRPRTLHSSVVVVPACSFGSPMQCVASVGTRLAPPLRLQPAGAGLGALRATRPATGQVVTFTRMGRSVCRRQLCSAMRPGQPQHQNQNRAQPIKPRGRAKAPIGGRMCGPVLYVWSQVDTKWPRINSLKQYRRRQAIAQVVNNSVCPSRSQINLLWLCPPC